MTDVGTRRLEQEAAMGDEEAMEALQRQRQRAGQGRHADKLGRWILMPGVRDHHRGRLQGVTELGGGRAILHVHPCYWLDRLYNRSSEVRIRTTPEHPYDCMSETITNVGLQPEGWPEA